MATIKDIEDALDAAARTAPCGNYVITTTAGLIELARDAKRRDSNRQAPPEFLQQLDHSKLHVLAMHFIHNDCEMRTWWLVAIQGRDTPDNVWLDVSFDAFKRFTREVVSPPATAPIVAEA